MWVAANSRRSASLDLARVHAGPSKTGNRKTGRPLSARTVLYVHSIVHRALADAARKGLVTRNVADAASPPTAKAAKAPEMAWWRPDELSRFLGLMVGRTCSRCTAWDRCPECGVVSAAD
jgi:hypothetical protein